MSLICQSGSHMRIELFNLINQFHLKILIINAWRFCIEMLLFKMVGLNLLRD